MFWWKSFKISRKIVVNSLNGKMSHYAENNVLITSNLTYILRVNVIRTLTTLD